MLLVIAAAFLCIVHLSGNNMEFSRANGGWNGTSSFFSDLDRHRTIDITDPAQLYGHPGNTTLLIIAPERSPTLEELDSYAALLRNGNTIFLADDFGAGNSILNGLKSRIAIIPANLSSLDRMYNEPYSVIVYRAGDEGPFSLPPSITLNHPAYLEGGTPLLLTSVMSWSDSNGDRRFTMGEEMGTFPVMSMDASGPGRIIVLSDPSIFINSMYSQPENENNRIMINSLVNSGDMILIDQMNSRTAGESGLGGVLFAIRNSIFIEVFIIIILVLATAWAWNRKTL